MIVCVYIPHFAAAVTCHHNPALQGVPLALVRYGAKQSRVAAVSAEAHPVRPGTGLSRARGLCPDAHFLPYDALQMERAQETVLQTLWVFTNRVEVDMQAMPQTGIFYLDLGRLNREDTLYLRERIQAALPFRASVGLAAGKFAAYVAAANRVPEIPRGEEAAFIAPYPVDLLPLSRESARRLELLCIREIGQLAALPSSALLAQFGREGKLLAMLVRGQDSRPVKPHRMPEAERIAHDFEPPSADKHRIEAVLHRMAAVLADRLEARGSALHAVALTLTFAKGKTQRDAQVLLKPIAASDDIGRSLLQILERMAPAREITEVHVTLTHLVPNIPRQMELFTHKPTRVQLIDLVAVLVARHGEHFFEAVPHTPQSLLPERRFHQQLIRRQGDAS